MIIAALLLLMIFTPELLLLWLFVEWLKQLHRLH